MNKAGIYDLDQITISVAAVRQFHTAIEAVFFPRLIKMGIKAKDIPDEKFRLLPDGNGEIFIVVKGKEFNCRVPRGQFTIHSKRKS